MVLSGTSCRRLLGALLRALALLFCFSLLPCFLLSFPVFFVLLLLSSLCVAPRSLVSLNDLLEIMSFAFGVVWRYCLHVPNLILLASLLCLLLCIAPEFGIAFVRSVSTHIMASHCGSSIAAARIAPLLISMSGSSRNLGTRGRIPSSLEKLGIPFF